MTTVTVSTAKPYEVKIGRGLLASAPGEIRAVTRAETLCIVSDRTVWALYGDDLKDSLTDAGFRCVGFCFPAGEQSKQAATFLSLLEFLAENRLTRSDCIIALGGGVVGDLAGFAAASYLRGIDYIQIPTTVLAAVDSSVGGKTGIDLCAGKNLAGAFWQPRLVLCDTDTLETLPRDIFRDGCAEIIKYGVLFDPSLLALLSETGLDFPKEQVISRCVTLKRDTVAADEFDRGQRQLLNLGHTVGHAIEAHSSYTISHGKAVAIGMATACKAAAAMGICPEADTETLLSLLRKFGLPTNTDISPEALYTHALSDKKRTADRLNFILPEAMGRCRIQAVSLQELRNIMEAGL